MRRFVAVFGSVETLEHHHQYNNQGLARDKVVYKHKESSVICDEMEFETAAGT